MYLQKIEIQGFKSFAHKTKLEFSPGITCIIGPNGSGKSNIADAIRWVLGEQSLKLLRGKKAQDVIFAGSHTKTRLGFAQVDIFLNNEDKAAPIDYSEVVISRRLYRDGESEYLINKNKVRLQDILMLLAKTNFGQSSYSVVSQGAVDKILSSTPYERKEFFDEATGVKQYQIKREEASRKLERTKENLQQAELLMQEIEPRLRSLTRQVKKLEKREVIEEELRSHQHEYYSYLWAQILNEHKQLEGKSQQQAEKKKQLEKEMGEIQAEIEKFAKSQSRQEAFRELQNGYDELVDKKNSLLQQQVSLKGKLEIEQQKVGGYDLVFLERHREDLAKEISKLKTELADLGKLVAEKDTQLSGKKHKQDRIVEEYKRLEGELLEAKERLSSKSLPIPEIKEELEVIYQLQEKIIYELNHIEEVKDIEKIKDRAEGLRQKIDELKNRLKKKSAQADPEDLLRIQDNLSLFIKKKDNLVNEIYYLRISLQLKQEKQNLLQNNLEKAKDELQKIETELNQLKNKPQTKQEALAIAEEQNRQLAEKVKELDKQINLAKLKIDNFNKAEQQKRDELIVWQRNSQEKQAEINLVDRQLNEIKVKLARAETKKEDLEIEMKEELPENIFVQVSQQQQQANLPSDWSRSELLDKIHKLKNQIDLIGGIDPDTVKEYQETKKRHDHQKAQSEDLGQAIVSLEKAIEELDETIKKQFNQAFSRINEQFAQYFKVLFNGGQAKLSLQTAVVRNKDEEIEDQPEEEETGSKKPEKVISGVEIFATPPGKKLQSINMLSGGEKALTSIALLCAIIYNNPSPFVVLDEVDAALDEANSQRLAAIIEDLAKKTQFILITHNRTTMHTGTILYGVTMGEDGISRILSVKMEEAEKVIAKQG